MLEKMRNIVADQLDLEAEDVTLESTWEDMDADSLDVVDIVIDLEKEFHIDLSDGELDHVRTMGDLFSIIQEKSVN